MNRTYRDAYDDNNEKDKFKHIIIVLFCCDLVFRIHNLSLRCSQPDMYFKSGILGAVPSAFAWPLIAVLNSSVLSRLSFAHRRLIVWPLLTTACIFKNIMACLSFTAIMIQVSRKNCLENATFICVACWLFFLL